MRPRHLLFCLVALLALWLGGCAAGGDPRKPIPTTLIPAPAPATRLVVLLPGRGDSLDSLTRTGVAQVIQQQWPDADVLLTGLTMPYYRQDQAIPRLHDEIMTPARGRYRQVWLAGISSSPASPGSANSRRCSPRTRSPWVCASMRSSSIPISRMVYALECSALRRCVQRNWSSS